MKRQLHRHLFWALLLIVAGCKNGWNPPPPESWCKPEDARRILTEEYAYRSAHPGESVLQPTSFEGSSFTYAELKPIFQSNCWPCHRPGGNGPFPLQTYEQIKRKASTIKEVLSKRVMPPWIADLEYSDILDAPAISDEERSKIIWWIDHGMERGAPDAQAGLESEQVLDSADIYVSPAEPHEITSNTDSYQCFILDPKLTEDAYVEAISFESSNPITIHHIMMYIDTMGVLDSFPADWDCMKDSIVNEFVPIDSWTKGHQMIRYSADFAHKFPKGTKMLLQIHYGDEGFKGKLEQVRVGLHLRDSPPPRVIHWEILNNLDIFIPANKIKVETIEYKVEKDISILGLVPHLHFIGRMVEIYAMTPDCRKINLFKSNVWEYLWQGRYMFPRPIHVPSGSTVYMNVLYDNTAGNPVQPNDPIVDIRYDNYSNQEMMVLCLYFVDYWKGDENRTVGELVR